MLPGPSVCLTVAKKRRGCKLLRPGPDTARFVQFDLGQPVWVIHGGVQKDGTHFRPGVSWDHRDSTTSPDDLERARRKLPLPCRDAGRIGHGNISIRRFNFDSRVAVVSEDKV